MSNSLALAIHGGAGTIRAADLTAEAEAGYRAGLAPSAPLRSTAPAVSPPPTRPAD